ncbi:MAG: hypothetical protein NUV72_08630 [Bauldia sp.]|nr:hypothetical protein [Bauldia sp.]
MITDHRKLRRVCQWAFHDSVVRVNDKWDGAEDKQAFLDRAVVWSGTPKTAAEIEAQEAAFDAAMTANGAAAAKQADTEKLRDGGEKIAFVLVELVDKLLAKGTIVATDFTPNVRQVYQDVKAIADRVKP